MGGADSIVAAAARNNAQWCAAVCRSHGTSSHVTREAWICDGFPPPFYPRLVSLTAEAAQLEAALLRLKPGVGSWACKDSYDVLRDAPGRARLFSALWYARPPGGAARSEKAAPVRSAAELKRWVDAWGETPASGPVFRAEILDEPGVGLLHDGAFTSGLAAFRGEASLIGITNLFGTAEGRDGCIAWLAARNPDCTIVGYGSAEETASLSALGFETVGPLTVWLVNDAI